MRNKTDHRYESVKVADHRYESVKVEYKVRVSIIITSSTTTAITQLLTSTTATTYQANSTSFFHCYHCTSNCSAAMDFTTTQRGARSLIYGGYSYMVNRRGREGTTVYWRCTRSRNAHCSGTITTDGDQLISIKDTHNHPREDSLIEVKKMVNDLKTKTKENIRPVPQIYQEVRKLAALPNSEEVAARFLTLSSVKSTLYRQRRKLIPALPATRTEVHFEGEWAQTVKGEPFLVAEDGDNDKIIIFASERNLRQLAAAESLYVDGTFQICPRVFYQVFTIHSLVNGLHVPLAYCLLPDKRQETYERVFMILAQKAQNAFGIDFAPSIIVSDFEIAIMQAAKTVFPAVATKGCYFHFCQALLRKLQQLGLQTTYQQNQEVSSFVRRTAALAFLPLRYG